MDGLKQRIVGALVLISLAVIFVPMLFDEPHTERTSKTIELPEEPAFPSVDVSEPADQPVAVEESPAFTLEEQSPADQPPVADTMSEPVPVEAPTAASAPERPVAVSEPRQKSAPEPAAKPQAVQSSSAGASGNDGAAAKPEENIEYSRALKGAWLVQLGSFGNADNASRLRDKVREKGYAAYTQSIERGDVTLTRVFSGPFVSEDEARSAKSRLDKSFSLNSLVMEGEK